VDAGPAVSGGGGVGIPPVGGLCWRGRSCLCEEGRCKCEEGRDEEFHFGFVNAG
jgi:hypothetical protein